MSSFVSAMVVQRESARAVIDRYKTAGVKVVEGVHACSR